MSYIKITSFLNIGICLNLFTTEYQNWFLFITGFKVDFKILKNSQFYEKMAKLTSFLGKNDVIRQNDVISEYLNLF